MNVMDDHLPMPHHVAKNAVLAGSFWVLAYVALDYVSFIESYRGLAITPWSPAAGLALALALLGGLRYAPIIIIAPVIAGALVRAGSVPAPIHAIEGLLFGGSYLAAGLIARAYGNLDPRLATARDTLTLMCTALGAAGLASLGYVAVLRLAGFLDSSEITEGFVRFFVGDLIGMLIVTPVVLLGITRRLSPAITWDAPLQLATIALAFVSIFGLPHASEYQLFYLLFVPLLWSTFRAGIAGAAIALSVVQIGLILTLRIRHGAMAELTSFQILMISLASTCLVFGSLVGQQQATSKRLRHQQLALSRALRLRSMGEVATAIAHEVNQPITSIRTYAGIAREAIEAGLPDQAVQAVAKIRSECDRASSIVRATRNVLRQQIMQPQTIQVAQLLEEVKELLLDRISNIEFVIEISPRAATIIGDPVQLKQALYNIADNGIDAIESAGGSGTITITVRVTDHSVIEFAVRDSGPGFAPELIDYGITPLLSTKAEGTGIGLSIARSVAEAHGGSLILEREGNSTIVKLRTSAEWA